MQSKSVLSIGVALRENLPGAVAAFAMVASTVHAEVVPMPAEGDLIGDVRYVTTKAEDTLIEIAREYSVGQDEMEMANPNIDRWTPGEGTKVLMPKRYILPDAPRTGIVVNIPEMRLYYFPGRAGRCCSAKDQRHCRAGRPTASQSSIAGDYLSGESRTNGLEYAIGCNPDRQQSEGPGLGSSRLDQAGTCRRGRNPSRCRAGRTSQSAGRLCHETGGVRLPDTRRRHRQGLWDWHARDTWLHPHVSGGRGEPVSSS